MASSRTGLKKRKKRKRRIRILSILFLLLLSTIAYGVYEYQAGFEDSASFAAKVNGKTSKDEIEEFNGKEDEYGRINVLILGVDTDNSNTSRTDTIMIGQYDPKRKTAKLASIMRDTYVDIPGHNKNKINAAFSLGGVELLRETIKENFNIDTQYYAMVNLDGFPKVVDTIAPDGIEVNVEKRMKYSDPVGDLYINLQPGLQTLDGEKLLHYARFRKDAESDFGRVRRQQEVMTLLKDELVSITTIPKLPRLMGTIMPYIDTNLKKTEILSLGKDFILHPPDEIEKVRIPVDGSYSNKSYRHAGSVLSIDFDENQAVLDEFFNAPPKPKEETKTTDSKSDKSANKE